MAAPLLLADTPWLLYRSYFALPSSITDGDGHPVNALLGTVNALLVAVEHRPPRAVITCFGAEAAAYRKQLYPAYHAQRPDMPAELAWQWDRAPALLDALGWTPYDSDDHEADDVMFTLGRVEAEAGGGALLLTGDRDLYGAVDERTHVLSLGKASEPPTEIDADEVRRRYGIDPELVPDFIALRGDPSDNLPGAPGIGEKTARDLLRTHGSLDAAIEHAVRERPRVSAALRDNADELRDFRRVATLQRLELERPPDRATDFLGGAEAADAYAMRRLATRLREMN